MGDFSQNYRNTIGTTEAKKMNPSLGTALPIFQPVIHLLLSSKFLMHTFSGKTENVHSGRILYISASVHNMFPPSISSSFTMNTYLWLDSTNELSSAQLIINKQPLFKISCLETDEIQFPSVTFLITYCKRHDLDVTMNDC